METNNYLSSILFKYEEIIKRIKELAKEINDYYKESKEEVIIIPVLDGGSVFASHLILELDFILKVNSTKVSSYSNNTFSNNKPELLIPLDEELLLNKNVLIIEDLIDTGSTIKMLYKYLESKGVKGIKSCVLFEKEILNKHSIIKPDFLGFKIPDVWVAGFGIDSQGLFRNLKDFGIVNPKYIKK